MFRPSRSTLLAFIAATLAGACLHFLYELFPNPVTACFAPVKESLWEHLKLICWPSLAAFLILARQDGRQSLGPRCLALLLAGILLLGAGWVYHVLLGGESMLFDIILYVLLMAGVFLLSPHLPQAWLSQRWELFALLAAALGAALVLFTFLPPRGVLFADLSLNSQYTFFALW